MSDDLTAQTVELLQQLIRNQCVNDGTLASGQEVRTSDVLRAYLEGSGLDLEVYQPDGAPGRASLVARIEGTDPAAPTLCLMGHTDVVPVTPEHWTRDPFRGRTRERRGVGSRRARHAEPDGLPGRRAQGAGPAAGRVANPGHPGLPGVRRRGGRRHPTWHRWPSRPKPGSTPASCSLGIELPGDRPAA
jgi:hypothetical protein